MGQELILIRYDAVNDDDLLRHLTHVRDARILFRYLYSWFLAHTLLFLLRTH